MRLLAIIGLCVTLAGCGADSTDRGAAEVEVRLIVDPEPLAGEEAEVSVVVSDLSWRPVNGLAVSVTLVAPDGSAPLDAFTADGVGAGRYRVPSVVFPLPGMWAATIRVETGGGLWHETDRTIEVMESAGSP